MPALSDDHVVVVGLARTPIGAFQGSLSSLAAPVLGAHAIRAALNHAGASAGDVDDVTMGCVLSAGLGQAPARQAALGAGLSHSVPATTVNKMCGSGMQAVMLAADALRLGANGLRVAGGMESMSNAPYLLPKARSGLRMGHAHVLDHMFLDGLEDAYDTGRLMGTFAEDTAQAYGFTRAMQDDYALESFNRARQAMANGAFAGEIAPVTVDERKGSVLHDSDETPGQVDPARLRTLKPAFREGGTVTAGNASSISDGAAALVLARQASAQRLGLMSRARIVASVSHAQAPALFTTAPTAAINKVLELTGWSRNSVDLFEINEAFAVVAMVAIRDLSLPHERVNIHGGACALGHPIGASGARILVTLISALERHRLRRGIAAICIGGGEATAVAVERFA